eukprot:GHVS01082362.1.p1 GENE.GHVS01082362.1~~GHVS01082362.1.p1  ORF type:complete len:550 (+),score=50.21 GHVS01082362.1:186-1835(+)
MNWAVGWRPPPKDFRSLPGASGGRWEPVLRLGGGCRLRDMSEKDQRGVGLTGGLVEVGRAAGLVRGRFSPDGRCIATCDVEGGLCVYNAVVGTAIMNLPDAHAKGINDIAWFDDDSRYITTASCDRSVKLFDLRTPSPQQVKPACAFTSNSGPLFSLPSAHPGGVTTVSRGLGPGGCSFLSGGVDGMLKEWDLRWPCGPVRQLQAHRGPVSSVEISGDGRVVATSSFDGYVRLWDGRGLQIIRTFLGNEGHACYHATFSGNDRYVLCDSSGEAPRLWHLCPKDGSNFERAQRDDVEKQQQRTGHDSGTIDGGAVAKGWETSISVELEEAHRQTDRMGYLSYEYEYINLVPYDTPSPNSGVASWWASRRSAIRETERLMGLRLPSKMHRRSVYTRDHVAASALDAPHPLSDSNWGATAGDHLILEEPGDGEESDSRVGEGKEGAPRRCSFSTPGGMALAGPCRFCTFWRDRAVAVCADGCVHIWDAYSGVHEHRLDRWHNFDCALSSVDSHPDSNVGALLSTGTAPDSSAVVWMLVASDELCDMGVKELT